MSNTAIFKFNKIKNESMTNQERVEFSEQCLLSVSNSNKKRELWELWGFSGGGLVALTPGS